MASVVYLLRHITPYLMLLCIEGSSARSYLETNEVIQKPDKLDLRLPSCAQENAICGYLQANTRGINYQRLCECPNGIAACPMTWDASDGFSVTQGSDQYKFCGRAPAMSACEPNETAYTSKMVYSKSTDELYKKVDQVHCICPEGHNYVLARQNWDDPNADPDTESVEFIYTCAPLPPCKIGDACKMVSEKGSEFLVNSKCRCPDGLRCPTLSNHPIQSYEIGNGRVEMLRCQL